MYDWDRLSVLLFKMQKLSDTVRHMILFHFLPLFTFSLRTKINKPAATPVATYRLQHKRVLFRFSMIVAFNI